MDTIFHGRLFARALSFSLLSLGLLIPARAAVNDGNLLTGSMSGTYWTATWTVTPPTSEGGTWSVTFTNGQWTGGTNDPTANFYVTGFVQAGQAGTNAPWSHAQSATTATITVNFYVLSTQGGVEPFYKQNAAYTWSRPPVGGYAGPNQFFHHVRFENPSAVPTTYDVIRNRAGGTTTIDTVTVPPLTFGTLIKTYLLNEGDTINLTGSLRDYVFSDGIWLSVPDAVTSIPVLKPGGSTYSEADLAAMSTTPAKSLAPIPGSSPLAPSPPTSANTIDIKAPTNLPSAPPTSGGPVWNNTSNTTTTTGLDKDTYREGINKLLAKQDAQIAQAKVAEDREVARQSIWEKIGAAYDKASALIAQEEANLTGGVLGTKQGEHKSAVESAISGARATPSFGKGGLSDQTATGGDWEITWPGVATFNLDPMSQGSIGSTMVNMLKAAIAWMAVALFEWWLWTEFRGMFFLGATLPQARGNTVAGSGGQLTALAMAAIIVGVLVSAPGIFWALADSGITYNLNTSPIDAINAPTGAKYLFTLFVPTGTIATILAQMLIVRKGSIVLVGGAAAVIRACVG